MNQQTAKNRPAHFADALALAVRRFGTPAIVGLDPRWENLPPAVALRHKAGWQDQADAYLRFCRGVIDVVAPLVAAVKPQAAFFEQLGPAGMAALGQVIQYARERGLIVVIDGKRNDIGSTAQAYAEGFLGAAGQSAWCGNALTVSPYLGDDSLAPFVEVAQARGCGIFVLVKTSNPGGRTFQDLLADGRPIYRHVAEHVERLAISTAASCGYGAVGAVVGATYPDQLSELRSAMPHAWFLIPGYGAQGGAAQDVAGAFDDAGLGAIVNSSRAIIFAHARREYAGKYAPEQWQRAVEGATREMIADLAEQTPAGRLRGPGADARAKTDVP